MCLNIVDMLIMSDNNRMINYTCDELNLEFDMKDIALASVILGHLIYTKVQWNCLGTVTPHSKTYIKLENDDSRISRCHIGVRQCLYESKLEKKYISN